MLGAKLRFCWKFFNYIILIDIGGGWIVVGAELWFCCKYFNYIILIDMVVVGLRVRVLRVRVTNKKTHCPVICR